MGSEGYSGHDLESRHSKSGDAIASAFCAGSKEGIHKTTMFKTNSNGWVVSLAQLTCEHQRAIGLATPCSIRMVEFAAVFTLCSIS
jgi:hypothetical protein